MTLTGPQDPENFRVMVNRSRWYTDPLPECSIAEASDATYPSISRVKKAAGSDWSWVTMQRISKATANDLRYLADRTPDQRMMGLRTINDHDLKIAAGRGTIVHWWGEDRLNGNPMRDVSLMDLAQHDLLPQSLELAKLYKPAMDDFFRAYRPELVATEFVVIHRDLYGVGYGGTPDGVWRITQGEHAGKTFAFDYKTRGVSSNHGAYPEEAAQIAAGAYGEYMIVSGPDGEAVRAEVPEVDGGMVVSIKPDGARVYPIDIDKAWQDWKARHLWYVSRQNERDAIGRVWPIRRGV